MKIEAFEAELKQIHADFSIRQTINNPEMSGIYWRNLYICAVPSGEIYDDVKSGYMNSMNMVHRTRPIALAQAKHYLWRIQNEAGFLEGEMEPIK